QEGSRREGREGRQEVAGGLCGPRCAVPDRGRRALGAVTGRSAARATRGAAAGPGPGGSTPAACRKTPHLLLLSGPEPGRVARPRLFPSPRRPRMMGAMSETSVPAAIGDAPLLRTVVGRLVAQHRRAALLQALLRTGLPAGCGVAVALWWSWPAFVWAS